MDVLWLIISLSGIIGLNVGFALGYLFFHSPSPSDRSRPSEFIQRGVPFSTLWDLIPYDLRSDFFRSSAVSNDPRASPGRTPA